MLPTKLLTFTLFSLHLSYAQQTCYWPDGTIAERDTPCNSTAEVSACCAENNLCLSQGLCFTGGVVGRRSCTDQAWGSGCPFFCRDFEPGGGTPITNCKLGSSEYACGVADSAPEACANGSTFSLSGSSNSVTLRTEQVLGLGYSSGLEIIGSEVVPTNSTTQNGSSICLSNTANSSTTASSMPETQGYTAAQMAGVGAGIGVPLLLALVAALVYIARLRNQHHYSQATIAYPKHNQQVEWQDGMSNVTRQPCEMEGQGMRPELEATRQVLRQRQ